MMFATHLESWLKPSKRIGIQWCPLRVDTRALWLLTLHHGDVLMFEAAYTCGLEDAITAFCLTYDAVQSREPWENDKIAFEITLSDGKKATRTCRVSQLGGAPLYRSDPSYIGIVLGSLADQHERGLRGSHEPETDAEHEGAIQRGRP